MYSWMTGPTLTAGHRRISGQFNNWLGNYIFSQTKCPDIHVLESQFNRRQRLVSQKKGGFYKAI